MKKKLTSILLALVLAIGLLPVRVSAYSVLSGKHGTDFADGELANRLETVFYSGISGCVTPSVPAVGGSLNNSQAYTTTFANQSGASTDWQCVAYARAAYSYLFGYNVGSAAYQTSFNNVASGRNSVSYDLFQQLGIKCGAYMRTTINPSGAWDPNNGHSIIILDYNSAGITTLEGNYNGAGKIGILNYSWDDFNTRQLRGRNRYICGFAQPTPSIYASLNSSGSGNSGNPGGTGTAGRTSVPSVSVNGQSVSVSWSSNTTASSYDVYLIQDPWSWESIQYHTSTQSQSCTFNNVAEGTYRAFTIARPNDDYTQSEWAPEFVVKRPHDTHTWDDGVVTKEATLREKGVRTFTCTECKKTKTEEFYADLSYTIPYGTTEIKDYEFASCFNLASITIPNTVTKIGGSAFKYCSNLTNIAIPNSVTEIGYRAFYDCNSLTSIVLPDSVVAIYSYAFYRCTNLTSVTIPRSVRRIDYAAFRGCLNLKDVYYGGSELQWNAISTDYRDGSNDALKNATIHFTECTTHAYDSGTVTKDPTMTATGEMTYTCTVCGETKTETISKLENPQKTFTDLSPTGFYLDAVAWALDKNVTTGTTGTTFSPKDNCTHGQILTFLWRAAGSPASNATLPFETTGKEYYLGAAKWAYEKGMIDKNFNHKTPCTRAYAVLYIWQAFGKPAATKTSPFTDIPSHWSSAKAAAWAAEKGITTGTTATTFDPNKICNRGEIVTFLYRAYKK